MDEAEVNLDSTERELVSMTDVSGTDTEAVLLPTLDESSVTYVDGHAVLVEMVVSSVAGYVL